MCFRARAPSATQKKRAERKESIFIKASIFILDPPGPSFLSLCVRGALKLAVMFLHMRDKLLDFPVTPLSPRLIYGGQKYCLHNNSIEAINQHHLPHEKNCRDAIALLKPTNLNAWPSISWLHYFFSYLCTDKTRWVLLWLQFSGVLWGLDAFALRASYKNCDPK